jgi:myo-inositol-1(or 4)-monophosphatase
MLEFAIKIAYEAGKIHRKYYHRDLVIQTKSNERDLVTQADLESERLILSAIKAKYPTHAVLAEERGQLGESDYLWLVDPLDGTTNFAHKHPVFCVAITLVHLGEIRLGVIFDPLRDELFAAEKGNGSTLNGQSIRVSGTTELSSSIIATGFPYDRAENPNSNLAEFARLMPLVQGIRRCGAAALDMAYVACGRIDGYWEFGLHPWDFAGGRLLVQEAGGKTTNVDGSEWQLESRSVIAANPDIHECLFRELNRAVTIS